MQQSRKSPLSCFACWLMLLLSFMILTGSDLRTISLPPRDITMIVLLLGLANILPCAWLCISLILNGMMPKMAVAFNVTLINIMLYAYVLYAFYQGQHWANVLVRICIIVTFISILIAGGLEWRTLVRMDGQGPSLLLFFVAYSLLLLLCSKQSVKRYFFQQRYKRTFCFLKGLTAIKNL